MLAGATSNQALVGEWSGVTLEGDTGTVELDTAVGRRAGRSRRVG